MRHGIANTVGNSKKARLQWAFYRGADNELIITLRRTLVDAYLTTVDW